MSEVQSGADPARVRHGAIAMLDALGVQGVLARSMPQDVMDAWQTLIQELNDGARRALAAPGDRCSECRVIAFSDTIIITMEGQPPADLVLLMGTLIERPFSQAFTRALYLRGIIAVGEFYQSETMILGPAIDEAAAWYEQTDWIGVSTSPSASMLLDSSYRIRPDSILEVFAPHYIPIKQGVKAPGWALAWPKAVLDLIERERSQLPQGEDWQSVMLKMLARAPISPVTIGKYNHTLTFIDRFLPGLERERLIRDFPEDRLNWNPPPGDEPS